MKSLPILAKAGRGGLEVRRVLSNLSNLRQRRFGFIGLQLGIGIPREPQKIQLRVW